MTSAVPSIAVPDILAKIVQRKHEELLLLRPHLPALEAQAAANIGQQRGFARALRAHPPAIIAEIKKASPSKGILSHNFDPAHIATQYANGGAACLSVLTDQDFFQGNLVHLSAARNSVTIPVLRKDFTVNEAHIIQAAAHSADAILLIAALFTASELRRLREFATSLNLDSLVEVHDEEELARTIDSGATIIGVNNRDLRTFTVRMETSIHLAAQIPDHCTKVSESGILTGADVQTLSAVGYQAFLVGEHLMRSQDPSRALQDLRS
jgi:indole-3-glycerol phosphate synthase